MYVSASDLFGAWVVIGSSQTVLCVFSSRIYGMSHLTCNLPRLHTAAVAASDLPGNELVNADRSRRIVVGGFELHGTPGTFSITCVRSVLWLIRLILEFSVLSTFSLSTDRS